MNLKETKQKYSIIHSGMMKTLKSMQGISQLAYIIFRIAYNRLQVRPTRWRSGRTFASHAETGDLSRSGQTQFLNTDSDSSNVKRSGTNVSVMGSWR